jgi:hypothetical protein
MKAAAGHPLQRLRKDFLRVHIQFPCEVSESEEREVGREHVQGRAVKAVPLSVFLRYPRPSTFMDILALHPLDLAPLPVMEEAVMHRLPLLWG